MKSLWKLAVLAAAVALVAGLSCSFTSCLMSCARPGPHPADFHRWVHQQLNLTPEQDKVLDSQEEAFAARKEMFRKEIQQANVELATAMQEDRIYSPRVMAAVEKIHHGQADLEKATLEHIFAMKNVLTPEQFDKLLKLTGDALSRPDAP